MTFLVTGAAGFIGFHLCQRLLSEGRLVVGIDNLNPYYDVNLKQSRLNLLKKFPQFQFQQTDLTDNSALVTLFKTHQFSTVINLAAQAGVRYSIDHPETYVQSNLVGFANILEACRHHQVKHLLFASSSSVYGANTAFPFAETNHTDHPLSLYAATKKANELLAHSYANLYKLSCTGLRFFTVYGPWGRPDMALFQFTKSIIEEKPITLFNHGNMLRDFTFVDDIVTGIMGLTQHPAVANPHWDGENPDPSSSQSPFRIYNIGNNQPVKLTEFVAAIEAAVGKKAIIEYAPLQMGDVTKTYADTTALEKAVGYKPNTSIVDGVRKFVDWYREYYYLANVEITADAVD